MNLNPSKKKKVKIFAQFENLCENCAFFFCVYLGALTPPFVYVIFPLVHFFTPIFEHTKPCLYFCRIFIQNSWESETEVTDGACPLALFTFFSSEIPPLFSPSLLTIALEIDFSFLTAKTPNSEI